MRRLLTLLISAALFIGGALAAPAPSPQATSQQSGQKKDVTVYVTRTGKRYHRAGCRSLSKSSIPISLKDAKARGYTPCHICHPPE